MQIKSILLVDDNETDQFFHEAIIHKYDSTIKIHKAYDGQEALDILDTLEVKPDLILLDINMPGMNGFEFLDAYEQNTKQTSMIVMLSASEPKQDTTLSGHHNFPVKYLLKPLQEGDLKSLAKMKA